MKKLIAIVFFLSPAWCVAQPGKSQIIHPEIIQFDETSPVIRFHWKNKDASAVSYKFYNSLSQAASCGVYNYIAGNDFATANSYYDFTLENGSGVKYDFNVTALNASSEEGQNQTKWIPMNPGFCYDFEDINDALTNYYVLTGLQAVNTGGNDIIYYLNGGADNMLNSYFEWEIPTGWEIEFYENDQIIVDAPFGAESGYITTKVVSPFTGEESIKLKLPVLVDGVKIDQSINWSTSELVATEGDDPLDMDGTSSADLDVTYHSSNTSVATVSGAQITIIGEGTSTITASQSGDTYHSAAPSLQRTLTVQQPSTLAFDTDYPKFEYYLSNTYRILLKLTELGSVYYIVEPDGSTQPTAEQIEAGKNASGEDALKKGSAYNLTAGVEYANHAQISGLEEETEYDIYLVLADESYNVQSVVTKLEVTTGDYSRPTWSEGYPQMGTISSLEAEVQIDLNEETGMVYYAVFRSSSSTHYPPNLKNGGNYQALDEGSVAASAVGFTLNNLSEDTDYDVWLAAEDAAENLQVSATKIDFTTIDDIDTVFNAGYPQVSTINETAVEIHTRVDEQVTVYAIAQLEGNSSPSASQVIAGQDYQGQEAIGVADSEADGLGTNIYVEFTGLTTQVEYDFFVVAEDNFGNSTDPVKLTATTSDETAPVISPTYLTQVELTETTATFSFSLNEAGTFYYVLDPNDGDTPSATQVKSEQLGSGESAPAFGSIAAEADQTYEFQLTGLIDNQEYELYFVAEDENDNLSEYAYSSYFETEDGTPPSFTDNPEITDVSNMEVSLTADTDEYGTIYAAIIAENAALPSVNDLSNLEVEGAIHQGSYNSGYISVFTSLELGVSYQLVLIAEDESDNLQSSITALDFTVPDNREDQIITFELVDEVTVGDDNLSLSASNSSGNEVSFKSSDEEVATIITTEAGMQVQITGAGTVDITAYHEGDLTYKPSEISEQLVVTKLEQTINFTTIGDQSLEDSPITLQASATSDLTVEFALLEGNGVILGNQLTINEAGTFEVEAIQNGNQNYLEAESIIQSFEVFSVAESQTISFNEITEKVYGDTFQLEASATSGLEIIYAVTSGPASISGNEVSINGTGEVSILASQEGNESYLPAPEVSQTFTTTKATLVVKAEDLEIQMNQPIPELSFSYAGFIGEDDEQVIDTPPTISTTATELSTAGDYAIELSDGDDDQYKFDFEEGTLSIIVVTEVTNKILDNVRIYPVPFTSTFQIELPNQPLGKYELTIRNINGATIFHSMLRSNELIYEVDQLSQLPNGIYQVHLTLDHEVKSFKVIKRN
ncbi:MBG domain-containing protein [Reichenbachiella sp.]|uniref:MBG domain-containing protein n=1 Tax=Reichenbachiella sp. TaxID=2184521 RepID=UPI003298C5E6